MAEDSIPTVRRHDIDWLRVILFGLLIPFHVLLATALVVSLCLAFFEVVRRTRATSFLFGIKTQKV